MAKKDGSDSHPRELARALLMKHGVSKLPTPVEAIARAEGLDLVERSWGANSSLDALLLRSRSLIAVNGDKPRLRRRFSMAHELGHYALNHDYLKSFGPNVDIDHPPENSHPTRASFEADANEFANELLVPRALLLELRPKPQPQDDDSKESFRPFADLAKRLRSAPLTEEALAKRFDVSVQVIFIALQKHGLL
jgi:Zn-dependent peptidase ImmA (M78 family)